MQCIEFARILSEIKVSGILDRPVVENLTNITGSIYHVCYNHFGNIMIKTRNQSINLQDKTKSKYQNKPHHFLPPETTLLYQKS